MRLLRSIKKIWYNILCLILQLHFARNMKRNLAEKGTVIVLFILVQIVFSFAERDSKKLVDIYTKNSSVKVKTETELKPAAIQPLALKTEKR